MSRTFSVTVSVSGDEAERLMDISSNEKVSIAGAAAKAMTVGLDGGGMSEDEMRKKLAGVKGLGSKLTDKVVAALS